MNTPSFRVVDCTFGQPPVHDATSALQARAARNYPDDPYLQAEWMRAVGVVRSTKNGWVADVSPLPPVPERWQQ